MSRELAQKYIHQALEMGATDAVFFTDDQICWDSRTLLKCMYGCTDWGCNHPCPSRPGNPSIPEMQEMFKRYKGGIIIHTHEKKLSQKQAAEELGISERTLYRRLNDLNKKGK